MNRYKNGNYIVTIMSDGTKIRMTEADEFIPAFAENCDVKITSKCSIGCPFCLPPNTLISTNNGVKKVQDITKNDLVQSYNETTGKIELKPVIETYSREYVGDLIEIITDEVTIICTPNHQIYTTNRGYIRADELSIEDNIMFIS